MTMTYNNPDDNTRQQHKMTTREDNSNDNANDNPDDKPDDNTRQQHQMKI
jgi:hypothetical protein